MYYLDLILLVNGAMDGFLLGFTAHLLRKKIHWLNLLLAIIIGELPVIFILFDLAGLVAVSRVLIPLAMVCIGLRIKSIQEVTKGLLIFSLLAAGSAGIYYAISGWIGFTGGEETSLTLRNFWFLPLCALLFMGGYRLWEKISKANLILDNILYDAEVFFDNEESLQVKALLDTGNELRDPLTGAPVMILEEKAALRLLPEKVQEFLQLPWRESSNPWSFLWKDEELSYQKIVFISAKGINGQTWLPGIRLGKVKIFQGGRVWEHPVTVALVPQILNNEGKYQALLHPEHIQKQAGKEEIAS